MERYRILYEDQDVSVIWKAAGVPVQSARTTVPDIMSMLRNERMERGEKQPYLGLVNRLDQPVEGIFLVAGNEKAAAELSRQVRDHKDMEKWYQALVRGKMPAAEGMLVDWLIKDSRKNLSRAVPAGTLGGKQSELHYEVLQEWEEQSLLRIRLLTGRHHQIRVQLAHAGAPIAGDSRYGTEDAGYRRLALCADRITFLHPRTKKKLTFQGKPTFPVPPTAPG